MTRIDQAVRFTAIAVALLVSVSASATPTQKCQEAKLKAQGKLELCLKKNSAKVLGGKADASAVCQAKFQAALSKAEHIAIAAGTVACRYVDNGDGTVSDLNTGLQWEQKDNVDGVANDGDPHDADNQYTWGTYGTAMDGTAFTDFLPKLNNGAANNISAPITGCSANHCDWRLPTIGELQAILDDAQGVCGSGSGACIDAVFGPTRLGVYWSATTYTSGPDEAWFVPFSNGAAGQEFKTGNSFVRAVRGDNLVPPPTAPPTTLTPTATATATSTATPIPTATATATSTP